MSRKGLGWKSARSDPKINRAWFKFWILILWVKFGSVAHGPMDQIRTPNTNPYKNNSTAASSTNHRVLSHWIKHNKMQLGKQGQGDCNITDNEILVKEIF